MQELRGATKRGPCPGAPQIQAKGISGAAAAPGAAEEQKEEHGQPQMPQERLSPCCPLLSPARTEAMPARPLLMLLPFPQRPAINKMHKKEGEKKKKKIRKEHITWHSGGEGEQQD